VRTPEQLKQKSAGEDSTSQSGYKADRDGFVTIVFLVENGLAKAVQVETGIQSETHIEILKGVTDGQEVVTGNYRAISQTLNNGSSVIVDNYKKKDK
jgi:HlyD family secretion protein